MNTKLDNLLAERAELDRTLAIKLQKSILQEAIQGKLVPQIAEEGTAEELLKQIHQEKERLATEGKLKRKDIVESTIFRGDDNTCYHHHGR